MMNGFEIPNDFHEYTQNNNLIDLIDEYIKTERETILNIILIHIHALRITKNVKELKVAVDLVNGKIEPMIGDPRFSNHETMLEIIAVTSDLYLKIETGFTQEFSDKLDEYIDRYDDKILESFRNEERYEWAFFYHESLAYYFGRYRKFKMFEERINLLFMIANISKNSILIALSDYYYSVFYQQVGKLDLSFKRLKSARVVFEEKGYEHYSVLVYSAYAIIYHEIGYYEKSLEFYEKARTFYERTNNEFGLIIIYTNMGVFYESSSEFTTAIEFYKKGLKFQIKQDNYEQALPLGILYFNLFSCFFRTNEVIGASIHLDLLRKFEQVNNYEYITNLLNLAESYFKLLNSNVIEKAKSLDELKRIAMSNGVYSSHLKHLSLMIYCKEFLDYYSSKEDEWNEKAQESIINELEEIIDELEYLTENNSYPSFDVQKLYLQTYLNIARLDMDSAREAMELAEEKSKEILMKNDLIIPKPDLDELIDDDTILERKIFTTEFSDSINALIHALPRLNIMIYLYYENEATFAELRNNLKMTPGNLGRHCELLVEAGLITKLKAFYEGKLITKFAISPQGVNEFQKYTKAVKRQFGD